VTEVMCLIDPMSYLVSFSLIPTSAVSYVAAVGDRCVLAEIVVDSREIGFPSCFPSTTLDRVSPSSGDFEDFSGDIVPEGADGPSILGKKWITPARIAGMQQQKIAVLVSAVDQNVVGILSHVGSAVSPNVLRLSRRIIEVITTLKS
jgi:hypothetical protein